MRKIELRAWDKIHKKIIYGKEIKMVTWIDELGQLQTIAQRIIMLYTGLKDKNGKKIFEGDIVTEVETGHFGEVYFNDYCGLGGFAIRNKWTDDLMYDMKCIEIKGNIYENKELLIVQDRRKAIRHEFEEL